MSNESNGFKEYCKAFALFQKQVGNAVKDGESNRGKYTTITSILDAIRDPLSDNGLSFSQEIIHIENGYSVQTTIRHEDGYSEKIILSSPLRPVTDAQSLGSLITYLRRYSLVSVFGVGAEDDDGGKASASQYMSANDQKNKKGNHVKLDDDILKTSLSYISSAKTIDKVDEYFKRMDKYEKTEAQINAINAAVEARKIELSQEAFNDA